MKEAAVFGIPDEKWGELVAAAIVLRPGMILSAEKVQQYCKTRIASYKVPRHIDMTEELPKSRVGQDSEASFKGEVLGRTTQACVMRRPPEEG